MNALEQLKQDLVEFKRRAVLDLDNDSVPATEEGSAHFWNAANALDTAINNITLCLAAERKQKA